MKHFLKNAGSPPLVILGALCILAFLVMLALRVPFVSAPSSIGGGILPLVGIVLIAVGYFSGHGKDKL